MTTVESKDLTLIEKLKTEVRVCPVCDLGIRNPFIERCPRCYAKLPPFQTDCQGCVHRLMCPVIESASKKPTSKE
ncbi:MAG: hypothetical protein ABSF91_03390 [Bacteroidota bacterium]|jgi:ribosomal protein L40E